MVKSKTNKSQTMNMYLKSLYCFSVFKSNLDLKSLGIYSGLLVLLISIVNLLKSFLENTSYNHLEAFFGTLLGLPIIMFIVFGIFYVVLNAFESKRKGFVESYLVFLSITLPFTLVGHLINWMGSVISQGVIITFLNLALLALIIYYLVNLVLNFKNYYGTSGYRVIVSLSLISMLISFVIMIEYLASVLTQFL